MYVPAISLWFHKHSDLILLICEQHLTQKREKYSLYFAKLSLIVIEFSVISFVGLNEIISKASRTVPVT